MSDENDSNNNNASTTIKTASETVHTTAATDNKPPITTTTTLPTNFIQSAPLQSSSRCPTPQLFNNNFLPPTIKISAEKERERKAAALAAVLANPTKDSINNVKRKKKQQTTNNSHQTNTSSSFRQKKRNPRPPPPPSTSSNGRYNNNGLNYIPVTWSLHSMAPSHKQKDVGSSSSRCETSNNMTDDDDDDEEYAKFVRGLWCGNHQRTVHNTDDLTSLLHLKSLPEDDDDDEASYHLPDKDDNDDDLDDDDIEDLLKSSFSSPLPPAIPNSTQHQQIKEHSQTTMAVSNNSQSLITPSPAILASPSPIEPKTASSPTPDSIYNELTAELGSLIEEDLEAAVTTLLNQPPTTHTPINRETPPNTTPKEPKLTITPCCTPQQLTLLRTLMKNHYQLLLQQSILAVRAAHQQKIIREQSNTKKTIKDNNNNNNNNNNTLTSSETSDDLTEILDGAVGMLQDLDHHRKDAMRTHLFHIEESTYSLSRLTRRRFRQSCRDDSRSAAPASLLTAFDVQGLRRLDETFRIIDNCVYQKSKKPDESAADADDDDDMETNILGVETHEEACRMVLRKAGAEIEERMVPGVRKLSELFTFPKEVFVGIQCANHDPNTTKNNSNDGDLTGIKNHLNTTENAHTTNILKPPKAPLHLTLKHKNHFTASEDNLILRGINLYGEKEWMLINNRFLPDRNISIISQRYSRLCFLLYKANNIVIDNDGNLEIPPEFPDGEYDESLVTHLTLVPPPAKFNVHRWSLDEDITILKAVPLMGRLWAEISNKFIKHRDRGHIRKRYQVLERRVKSCIKREKKMKEIEDTKDRVKVVPKQDRAPPAKVKRETQRGNKKDTRLTGKTQSKPKTKNTKTATKKPVKPAEPTVIANEQHLHHPAMDLPSQYDNKNNQIHNNKSPKQQRHHQPPFPFTSPLIAATSRPHSSSHTLFSSITPQHHHHHQRQQHQQIPSHLSTPLPIHHSHHQQHHHHHHPDSSPLLYNDSLIQTPLPHPTTTNNSPHHCAPPTDSSRLTFEKILNESNNWSLMSKVKKWIDSSDSKHAVSAFDSDNNSSSSHGSSGSSKYKRKRRLMELSTPPEKLPALTIDSTSSSGLSVVNLDTDTTPPPASSKIDPSKSQQQSGGGLSSLLSSGTSRLMDSILKSGAPPPSKEDDDNRDAIVPPLPFNTPLGEMSGLTFPDSGLISTLGSLKRSSVGDVTGAVVGSGGGGVGEEWRTEFSVDGFSNLDLSHIMLSERSAHVLDQQKTPRQHRLFSPSPRSTPNNHSKYNLNDVDNNDSTTNDNNQNTNINNNHSTPNNNNNNNNDVHSLLPYDLEAITALNSMSHSPITSAIQQTSSLATALSTSSPSLTTTNGESGDRKRKSDEISCGGLSSPQHNQQQKKEQRTTSFFAKAVGRVEEKNGMKRRKK